MNLHGICGPAVGHRPPGGGSTLGDRLFAGVAVDGEVKVSGKVPSVEDIRELFR